MKKILLGLFIVPLVYAMKEGRDLTHLQDDLLLVQEKVPLEEKQASLIKMRQHGTKLLKEFKENNKKNIQKQDYCTELFRAVDEKAPKWVKYLLEEKSKEIINSQDKNGKTAFTIAIERIVECRKKENTNDWLAYNDIVDSFMDNEKTDINGGYTEEKPGQTPFHILTRALGSNNLETCEIAAFYLRNLLEKKPLVIKNQDGDYPLAIATKKCLYFYTINCTSNERLSLVKSIMLYHINYMENKKNIEKKAVCFK